MLNPNTISKNKYVDGVIEGLNVRIFNNNESKTLIYLHGGGFVAGSVDSYSNLCDKLAHELKAKVISIEYNLAPEVKFPQSLKEIYCVCQKIVHQEANVAIMGDSAGANLAFAVANLTPRLAFKELFLIYPATQTNYTKNSKYKSVVINSGKSLLTKESLRDYMRMYLDKDSDYKDKRVNLLKNNWLFKMPPVRIVVGSLDPLHDEGLALASKLERFFVPVRVLDLNGATHGFLNNRLEKDFTKKTIDFIKESDFFE